MNTQIHSNNERRAGDWSRRIARCRVVAVLLLGLAALSGCGSVPNVQQAINQSARNNAPPQLIGAKGLLGAQASKATLDQLRTQAPHSEILKRNLATEDALTESPLVTGNGTQVLHNGTNTFAAMFRAIHGARHNINLEYYTFEDVVSHGEHLGDLLLAKRRQRVAVNVIYDSFGSGDTPAAFFAQLKARGVNLVDYNPMDPLKAKAGYSPDDRDHRKILIVDGRTAIIGGVNLSTNYQVHKFAKSGAIPGRSHEYTHDTDLQIEGPAVKQLQLLFVRHWQAQNGPPLDQAKFFPAISPQGREVIRIVGSTPRDTIPPYYAIMLSAISSAKQHIFIATAYFVPTAEEVDALAAAAKRGVDVRLLLPGDSDSDMALRVGRSNYPKLLAGGVKIYETRNEVLHSKLSVIDGVWTIIGSSNLDHRSVVFNDEVDAIVLGRVTGRQIDRIFYRDFKQAHQFTIENWKEPGVDSKIRELFESAWQSQL